MVLEKGDKRDFRAKLNFDAVRRFVGQLGYYAEGYKSDLVPQDMQARALRDVLAKYNADGPSPEIETRVNYYNKLSGKVPLTNDIALSQLPRNRSRYFYDLMSVAKPFGLNRRLAFLYGDIKHIPDTPTIVKSRPIASYNANSVLLNLNKFRHFRQSYDSIPFAEKSPTVVWRGRLCNKMRVTLAQRFENHPSFDIGYAKKGTRIALDKGGVAPKPFLSIPEHCRHRYILSVEGNDVATSLKWILSSNSLCLSPALKYETWFMEGTLKPGVHFVELRPDFEDLEDKVAYYEQHPDEALAIIKNAKAHWQQFLDKDREKLISYLVMQKYFENTQPSS